MKSDILTARDAIEEITKAHPLLKEARRLFGDEQMATFDHMFYGFILFTSHLDRDALRNEAAMFMVNSLLESLKK